MTRGGQPIFPHAFIEERETSQTFWNINTCRCRHPPPPRSWAIARSRGDRHHHHGRNISYSYANTQGLLYLVDMKTSHVSDRRQVRPHVSRTASTARRKVSYSEYILTTNITKMGNRLREQMTADIVLSCSRLWRTSCGNVMSGPLGMW